MQAPKKPCKASHLQITVSPRKVLLFTAIILFSSQLGLFILYIYAIFTKSFGDSHTRQIFNIADEISLGTWMSSLLFLLIAATMWTISIDAKHAGRRWRCWDWRILSVFFVYLSMDDTAMIHERIGSAFGDFIEAQSYSPDFSLVNWISASFPSYYWQIAFFPVFGTLGICLFALLWVSFDSKLQKGCLLGAIALVILSQTMDFFEGMRYYYPALQDWFNFNATAIKNLSKAAEETLEMWGLSLLLLGLLSHLLSICSQISISARLNTADNLSQNPELNLKDNVKQTEVEKQYYHTSVAGLITNSAKTEEAIGKLQGIRSSHQEDAPGKNNYPFEASATDISSSKEPSPSSALYATDMD